VVEIERHLFLGKRIVTLSPSVPIKLAPLSTSRPIISRSCLPIISCFSAALFSLHLPWPLTPSLDDNAGDESEAETTAMTNSSSPSHGAALMAKGEISELMDFFKGTTVSEEELQAYHNHGWLTGNLLSSITEVEVPTVASSTVLCFE
jgi:hypothetical protein